MLLNARLSVNESLMKKLVRSWQLWLEADSGTNMSTMASGECRGHPHWTTGHEKHHLR